MIPFHSQQEPFSPSSTRLKHTPTPAPQSFYSGIDPRNEMPGSSALVSILQQQQIPKEKKNMYHVLTGREKKKRDIQICGSAANLRKSIKPYNRVAGSEFIHSKLVWAPRIQRGSNRATDETLGFTAFKRGSTDVSLSN